MPEKDAGKKISSVEAEITSTWLPEIQFLLESCSNLSTKDLTVRRWIIVVKILLVSDFAIWDLLLMYFVRSNAQSVTVLVFSSKKMM
jgi:hypothetical protein